MGLSLGAAGDADWTTAFIALDDRRDYGEFRWYAYYRSMVGFTSPSIPKETT